MLTHIDLFSGIGGFALAAEWAGFKTIAFCEIDPFCQEILKARFGAIANAECDGCQRISEQQKSRRTSDKGTKTQDKKSQVERITKTAFSVSQNGPLLIPDIRDFDGSRFRGATLLTGGFPCQPFSVAGKRKGKDDPRSLWPEMFRVIAEARPTWIIGENVAGIVNMELEQVCADLEGEGYEVQPIIIPACALNAPHRRDRVWIIAHSIGSGTGGERRTVGNEGRRIGEGGGKGIRQGNGTAGPGRTSPADRHAPDAKETELDGSWHTRTGGTRPSDNGWDTPWPEVAIRLCRMDDGIPRRVDRLKSLGNAIVPQVAYEIMKLIS